MLRDASKELIRKPGRGPTRFFGIVRYAQALGVRREYLWCVLTGRKVSRSLSLRYRELVAQETTHETFSRVALANERDQTLPENLPAPDKLSPENKDY